jgi:coenzyme F420-0:L-glutamate ligase
MEIRPIKTSVFKKDKDLILFIIKFAAKVREGDVVVVTSKIVALAEGRVIENWDEKIREKIIKQESEFAIKTPIVWLTIKDGAVLANAGIDESNAVGGELILLPKDSFKAAEMIRTKLKKHFKLKKLGVIITDSRVMPLRAGVVGVALGYAGFKGLRDYRGSLDIFGRKLKMTQTDIADSLATAAVVCMGEGDERIPLAILKDAPVVFAEKVNKKELLIDAKLDMYGPFFQNVGKKK